jgi:DNA polymerase delta subunit 2
MKYSDLEEPTDILDKCLTWGHIAPTAPDSLGKMKFYLIDMYIQRMYIVYL